MRVLQHVTCVCASGSVTGFQDRFERLPCSKAGDSKLREAEEAADQGQLDEACRLLTEGNLRQYLPGKRLSTKVAGQLAQRGSTARDPGRSVGRVARSASWPQALAGEIGAVLAARQEIIALTLGEAESHIENGESGASHSGAGASRALCKYSDEPVRWMKEDRSSTGISSAPGACVVNSAKRPNAGRSGRTRSIRSTGLPPEGSSEYQEQIEPFRNLTEALHRAMAEQQWSEAGGLADQALEMAPENQLARDVRRRAWAKVGAQLADSRSIRATRPPSQMQAWPGECEEPLAGAVAVTEPSRSRLSDSCCGSTAWAGILVCLSDEVVLGQATPTSSIAIPIQADLSRQHAKICRQGDAY